MTIVRPKLAEGLSPLEVAAAMEAHARLEVALACEAHAISEGSMWAHDQESPKGGSGAPGDAPRAEGVGDGLHWAIAGEVQEFVVRLPPRPLRSPPRKVVRRTSVGGEDVLTGPLEGLKGGRVGSWSAAEHLVLDQAKLSCYGHVERGFGNEDSRGNDFELLACRDNGDGRFFIKYVCGVAGTLKLSVELAGGGHIDGSPYSVNIIAGPLVAGNSTAMADANAKSCEVGVPTFFDVYARDSSGNARPFFEEEYQVKVTRAPLSEQPAAIQAKAQPMVEGEETKLEMKGGPHGGCRAHFTLLEPGAYRVHAATGLAGKIETVGGSPFTIQCHAGPIELSCCTLLEVGIGGEPLDRKLSSGGGRIWVQTRDALANARSTPSSQELWCELRASEHRLDPTRAEPLVTPCTCVDLGDGRIEVSYPPNTPAGMLEVWIGLVKTDEATNNKARATSTLGATEYRLGLLRMDGAIRFADENLVVEPGVIKVKPGVLFDIIVSSVDDAGRQQMKGGEQLRAQLSSGPAPVALEVYDNNDGSYRVATAVQVSGDYRIAFYVNGLPVAGSPILLIAPRTPGHERSMSPRVNSPRANAPRAASPRPQSPRQNSPRRAQSPRQASPRGGRPMAPRGAPPSQRDNSKASQQGMGKATPVLSGATGYNRAR